jgi:hypothetical protein
MFIALTVVCLVGQPYDCVAYSVSRAFKTEEECRMAQGTFPEALIPEGYRVEWQPCIEMGDKV